MLDLAIGFESRSVADLAAKFAQVPHDTLKLRCLAREVFYEGTKIRLLIGVQTVADLGQPVF